MILTPALAETAAILAETPEETIELYPPLERAVILAVKKMMKDASVQTVQEGKQNVGFANSKKGG